VSLTPEQMFLRRQGLTASDIVALSGTVPFKRKKSVFDVYMDKVHPDKVKPTEITEAMELGHEAEPLIVARVAKKLKLAVTYPQTTVRHAKIEWAMATPDAKVVDSAECAGRVMTAPAHDVVHDVGLIEAKLVGLYVADCWGDTDDIENGPPDFVYTQCCWQMFVTVMPFCIVGAMIGTEIRTYRIGFDASASEYAEALVEIGAKFRTDHVLTGRPPPVDGSEASREMLAALFRKSNGVYLKADEDAEEAARLYFDAKRRMKTAEQDADNAKTVLMAKTTNADGIVGDGFRFTWKERKGYHVDAYDVPSQRVAAFRRT
jgi:predicted phage-related endonuclease